MENLGQKTGVRFFHPSIDCGSKWLIECTAVIHLKKTFPWAECETEPVRQPELIEYGQKYEALSSCCIPYEW